MQEGRQSSLAEERYDLTYVLTGSFWMLCEDALRVAGQKQGDQLKKKITAMVPSRKKGGSVKGPSWR